MPFNMMDMLTVYAALDTEHLIDYALHREGGSSLETELAQRFALAAPHVLNLDELVAAQHGDQ